MRPPNPGAIFGQFEQENVEVIYAIATVASGSRNRVTALVVQNRRAGAEMFDFGP